MQDDPVVDVVFPVSGRRVPYDNGYALYSALSNEAPFLHENERVGIFQVRSTSMGDGTGSLAKGSVLKLRVPASLYPPLVKLAAKPLDLAGHPIRLGVPAAHPLTPASKAWAELVVIKGFTEPDPFLQAVSRQLDALEIEGQPEALQRNVVRVKGRSIVGFQILILGLSDADSLMLQEQGIGGKRRMGCGLFEPRTD